MVTVSPRVPVVKLERIARSRVARDGGAVFAGLSADRRQRAQLLRLGGRLAADPGLVVLGGNDRADGTVQVIVFRAGQQRPVTWRGGPKGAPDD
jgi:hypothetical protein